MTSFTISSLINLGLCSIVSKYLDFFPPNIWPISNLFMLWSMHVLCLVSILFSPFKFIGTCFMIQRAICLGDNFTCSCKECILCCRWAECRLSISQLRSIHGVSVFCVATDFVRSFRCWERSVGISNSINLSVFLSVLSTVVSCTLKS